MDGIEHRLRAIGFGLERSSAPRWRVEQGGQARCRDGICAGEPARSLALSLWIDRLRDRRTAALYRISRIAEAG